MELAFSSIAHYVRLASCSSRNAFVCGSWLVAFLLLTALCETFAIAVQLDAVVLPGVSASDQNSDSNEEAQTTDPDQNDTSLTLDEGDAAPATQPAVPRVQDWRPFDERFQELVHGQARTTDRDGLAARFEHLVDDYTGDPRAVPVMKRIGDLYALSNPNAGFESKPDLARQWYRKAIEAAAPNTEVWYEARWALVNQLHRLESTAEDLSESRRILEAMSQLQHDSAFIKIQIEYELGRQCKFERDFESSAQHNQIVLDWSLPPDAPPLTKEEQVYLSSMQTSAAVDYLQFLASRSPNGDDRYDVSAIDARIEKVRSLTSSFVSLPAVQEYADQALKQLGELRNVALLRESRPTEQVGKRRILFVASNIVIILLLAALALRFRLITRPEKTVALASGAKILDPPNTGERD